MEAGRRALTSVDTDGSYRLTGIRPGPTDVIAHAPGRTAATRSALSLGAGETRLDFVLAGGGTIEASPDEGSGDR
jgi:hypothetical protein